MQLTLWDMRAAIKAPAPPTLEHVLMQSRVLSERQTLRQARMSQMRAIAAEYGRTGRTIQDAVDAIEREFGRRYSAHTVYSWSGGTLRNVRKGRWTMHLAAAIEHLGAMSEAGQLPTVTELVHVLFERFGDAPSAEHLRGMLTREGIEFRTAHPTYDAELRQDAKILLRQGLSNKRVAEILAEQYATVPNPSTIANWRSEWGLLEKDTHTVGGIGKLHAQGTISLHQAAEMLYAIGVPDWIVDQAIVDAWTGGGISSAVNACKKLLKKKRKREGPSRREVLETVIEVEE